jgi:hypothetical protein
MGLHHDFKTARKKIAALDDSECRILLTICEELCGAQQALTRKAAPLLAQCMAGCQGLCCRNIRVADIITTWDLVYILAMAPQIEPEIAASLANEPFFPSDCIFLKNGTGPCLFPDNLRPERCIISFCRVEPSVEREIGAVMKGFNRLIRFFRLRPFRRLWRRF